MRWPWKQPWHDLAGVEMGRKEGQRQRSTSNTLCRRGSALLERVRGCCLRRRRAGAIASALSIRHLFTTTPPADNSQTISKKLVGQILRFPHAALLPSPCPSTLYSSTSSFCDTQPAPTMSMDLDNGAVAFQPSAQNAATILCCNCGAPIDGTTSAGALCYDCIKLTVDISEGIQREAVLHSCRDCDRYVLETASCAKLANPSVDGCHRPASG